MSAMNHNHAVGNEIGNMVSYGLGGHHNGGGYVRHRLGQKANAGATRRLNKGMGPNLGRAAGRMVGNRVAGIHQPSGYNRRMAKRQMGRGAGNFVSNTVNSVLDKVHH